MSRPHNRAYVLAMQELRRSNATTPVPSGKTYKRKARTPKRNRED